MESAPPPEQQPPVQNQVNHALPVTGSPLPGIDFEIGLEEALYPSCHRFASIFGVRAAEVKGLADQALLQSLAIICNFHPNYETPAEPYGPMLSYSDGTRSLIPGDLTEEDLMVVADLYSKAKNPALRARLGDVLWLRKRNYNAARAIIDDYVDLAQTLIELNHWIEAIPLIRRSIQIAHQLGRKNDGWKLAEGAFISALAHPKANEFEFYVSYLFAIAHDYGTGDVSLMANMAREHAERAHAKKDFRSARTYREHEAQFWKRTKHPVNEQAAILAAALSYPDEVRAHLLSPNPSFMILADIAARGVEALRRAKAAPEIINDLRRRLSEYQQKSCGELQTVRSPSIDISEGALDAAKFVESSDLNMALRKLALGIDILNVDEFKKETLDTANQVPLAFLVTGHIFDEKGRPTTKLSGLPFSGGAEFEKKLEAHMFHQAAALDWKHRVDTFIDPARLKIWADHLPTPSDFQFLVTNNPFIPPGHEGIFQRGLFYGLAGDLLLSSHLLTPQVENSMRYVLEEHGVDVSNLLSDLTQPVKILGGIFDIPETLRIFGKDMCFELRGHLIEKTGYSFRNNIAHGFLAEADCYSYASMNVWWLTLRLCYQGFLLANCQLETPSAVEGDAPE